MGCVSRPTYYEATAQTVCSGGLETRQRTEVERDVEVRSGALARVPDAPVPTGPLVVWAPVVASSGSQGGLPAPAGHGTEGAATMVTPPVLPERTAQELLEHGRALGQRETEERCRTVMNEYKYQKDRELQEAKEINQKVGHEAQLSKQQAQIEIQCRIELQREKQEALDVERKKMENLEREHERRCQNIKNEGERAHADKLYKVTEERRKDIEETKLYKRRFEEEQQRSEDMTRMVQKMIVATEEERKKGCCRIGC